MQPYHHSKTVWLCSTCHNPRIYAHTQSTERCYTCGSTDPLLLEIRTHKDIGRTTRLFARAKVLTKLVRQSAVVHKQKLGDLLPLVLPPRRKAKKGVKWYTKTAIGDDQYVGFLEFDACFEYIPFRVRKDMSRTKMVQMRIPDELHKWFKKYSQERDVSMTEIVVLYLEYLRARNKPAIEAEQI